MTQSGLRDAGESSTTTLATPPEGAATTKWQQRLLPFMRGVLIVLGAFFLVATCLQLAYLHKQIKEGPRFDAPESLSLLSRNPSTTPSDVLETTKLKSLVMLEATFLEYQYHQAAVLLMSRVWTSYLGFITGMILALVGAVFTLGKLRESPSELTAKLQGTDMSLKSASPGLVLAVLGTILMLTTIVTNHEIAVEHRAVYLSGSVPVTSVDMLDKPPLGQPIELERKVE